MKTCKLCAKDKPEKDFPWLLQRVCHDCHMWSAMHWNEIPWPESEHKKNLSPEERQRRRQRAKTLRSGASDVTISTESTNTIQTTDQLELVN